HAASASAGRDPAAALRSHNRAGGPRVATHDDARGRDRGDDPLARGARGVTETAKLAIDGGAPVRETFLPYARQVIEDDDVEAVVAALRSDWLTTGPRIEELERAFADRVGTRHAVAYS